MRFSLFLWLSMIVLALADRVPAVASISRGILTPFSPWQWFFTGFAVVLPGWFALLAARIVCAYGEDRFGSAPPPFFHVPNRMQWFVFWGAQAPSLFLLYRIASNVVHENELHQGITAACGAGQTSTRYPCLCDQHLDSDSCYCRGDPDVTSIAAKAICGGHLAMHKWQTW
jgi:hypothetical protein